MGDLMKPIIGIIGRPDTLASGNKVMVIYEDIRTSIIKSGGIPLGIIPTSECLDKFDDEMKSLINKCDGIIMQGGDSFYEYDIKVLEHAYDNDIPLLGICLGMQVLGHFFNGKVVSCKNHHQPLKKYVHEVYIDKKSKLYKIIGCDKIKVNSRHKDMVKDVDIDIVGISDDGVIEAIEDKKKKFFIGVQWHPENMYSYDILERRLFDYFISICRK